MVDLVGPRRIGLDVRAANIAIDETPGATGCEPAVDVIIAAWNRSDTIERAILSVVTEPEVRTVIVVDDASTDDTAARAWALARRHSKVVVIEVDHNAGPSAARNRALEASTAPWVTILDADDYMLPGRIRNLISEADGWDFVADDLLQVAETERPGFAHSRLLAVDQSWPERITTEAFVLGNLARRGRLRHEMGFLKPLMRRSFLEQHGLRYDPAVRLGEDYVLYAQSLAAGCRFRITPAAGYVSVVRANSLSARHSRNDLQELLRCDLAISRSAGLTRTERRAFRRHAIDLDKKIQWLITIEAIKARDAAKFASAFSGAPSVSLFIARNLAEQLWQRCSARLRRLRLGKPGPHLLRESR